MTLPTLVGEIAFQNKATVYAILSRTAAETLTTIAADPSIWVRNFGQLDTGRLFGHAPPRTGTEAAFEDDEAARKGALAICADLGRDIFGQQKPGSDWHMYVKNESGDPTFEIRLYSWAME